MAHRGAHPDDARLFAAEMLPRLRRAAEEVSWLLGRGYSMETALAAVGAHHQLELRQRLALRRSTASAAACESRHARALDLAAATGRHLAIDGFNLVITLEVALSGGPLFVGQDGALRDLAGLRGSYHLVEETDRAIALLFATLRALSPSRADLFLDAPVANSGRIAALLRAACESLPCPATVTLVPNADHALSGPGASVPPDAVVATADAAVIDRAAHWIDLVRAIVGESVPGAWLVPLG